MKAQLNELSKVIYERAKEKGFHNPQREIGTILMLIVSELSEALEADRVGRYADWSPIDEMISDGYTWEDSSMSFEYAFEHNIKDSFEDEIADSIIRLLDLCGLKEIDIEKHITHKLEYNLTRSNKHGKNY